MALINFINIYLGAYTTSNWCPAWWRVWPHEIVSFVHNYCKWIANIVLIYKQVFCIYCQNSDAYIPVLTSCEMFLTWVFLLFGSWISTSEKCLLKLRVHHLGKFAPRENNPLYGMSLVPCAYLACISYNKTEWLYS